LVRIDAAPMMWSNRSATKSTLLIFLEQKIAGKINDSMNQRGVSRSVGALAMMLAHEVKNPLSGIRGAAQLLETIIPAEDRQLTKLITEETDRIVKLVDRMEVFSDNPHLDRHGVNIHEILDHVIRVSQSGFARDVMVERRYDPSLPDVYGNRDQLIQVFINLIKNASEALDNTYGNIIVQTEFRHGVRLAVPGVESRMHLPLVVSITDNGPGIADDIKAHLFDPFITTKRGGSGLGLALVAKLVGDQGGVIEVDSHPGKTVFSIMLPMYKA
jgi:two-component system nitrogen regulation sensor histidine kinase GlnL